MSEESNKNFYYVHNRGKGNCTYRHIKKEDAIKEAVRLSKESGLNYYVLKPVAHIIGDKLDKDHIIIDGEFPNE